MLGLSATPQRDDGLSKVFHWYLGEPVYWEKRREADPDVQVQVVHFRSNDSAYRDPPLDYKGDVILARLLTQVVECKPRNIILVKLIKEFAANPERRILILSERKGHLEELEQGLANSGLSIGYYIGGMKETVREEGAKSARILLATYAMASEAMNIRSLNTVLMASPRKKVEQSVGRILRERPCERKVIPLIIDMVDMHGVYKGQFKKRRVFYRACGYSFQVRTYNETQLEESSEESDNEDVSVVYNEDKKDPNECAIID